MKGGVMKLCLSMHKRYVVGTGVLLRAEPQFEKNDAEAAREQAAANIELRWYFTSLCSRGSRQFLWWLIFGKLERTARDHHSAMERRKEVGICSFKGKIQTCFQFLRRLIISRRHLLKLKE
jgi:hypothetical protein